jgi:hypothetical protein
VMKCSLFFANHGRHSQKGTEQHVAVKSQSAIELCSRANVMDPQGSGSCDNACAKIDQETVLVLPQLQLMFFDKIAFLG